MAGKTAQWESRKEAIGDFKCEKAKPIEPERKPIATPSGGKLPTTGTPHGAAVVLGAGAFVTPVAATGDIIIGYGWDSANEIGISFLPGAGYSDSVTGSFYGIRIRYTRYFRVNRNLKPFIRGSIGVFHNPQATVTDSNTGSILGTFASTAVGPIVEGGLLYDFTRWFGLYAEVAGGYAFGVSSYCVQGYICGKNDGVPIIGLGLGVHFRFND